MMVPRWNKLSEISVRSLVVFKSAQEEHHIERRMEGKRGRGKPRIMMLDDIKADETYEKIMRRAMDRECWRNWMPRNCFQAEH